MGCDPFGHWPDNTSIDFDQALWDDDVVAAEDGVYVMLPNAGRLVRVNDNETFDVVDLSGAAPERLIATPDGTRVLVFASWSSCEDPDPKITHVDQCDEDDLSENAELVVVKNAKRSAVAEISPHLNALAFSGDGQTAVAYLDYDESEGLEVSGLADLGEVVFFDLESGETASVSIGFSPNQVLFTDDNSTAVVMSRSKVVAVDLSSFSVVVEYPLTLDADDEITPSDAVLTPDGATALVSIEDSSDLYRLNLVEYSIDIEDLDAAPADLAVSTSVDGTVIAYSSLNQVDVFDHESGELGEPVELEEAVTDILLTDGLALLYNVSYADVHDVYLLDLDTTETVEFVVENPVDEMRLTESGDFAVGLLRKESTTASGLEGEFDKREGLAVLDLLEEEGVSLVLEETPLGLALAENDNGSFALVLMNGLDYLLQVDLSDPSTASEIDLPEPPTSIGALPDGRFFITHDAALGLVTFLDPATGNSTSTGGFGAVELLTEQTLPRREADEE